MYVKADDDWSKMNGSTIVMQDAPVLDIDKTDIAGNLLPGATLTIRDADSKVLSLIHLYKVSKIGVGIYKQDGEALTYLSGAVYEL